MDGVSLLFFVPDGYSMDYPIPVEVVDVVDINLSRGGARAIRIIIFKPEYSYESIVGGENYAFSFSIDNEGVGLFGEVRCYEYISRMIEVRSEVIDPNQYVFNERWVVDQSADSISGCLFNDKNTALNYMNPEQYS